MSTTGFLGSFTDWLAKPENQLLLAGAGAQLDPQGVGGALGGATSSYLKSNIAAARADAVEKKQDEQRQVFLDVLRSFRDGNQPDANVLTPKGQPGPTSISANNDGSVKVTADLPGGPGSTESQLATQNAVRALSQSAQPAISPQQTQTGTPNAITTSAAVSPAGQKLLGTGAAENPVVLPSTTVTAPREPVQVAANASTADPYARNLRPFDWRQFAPFS